jgi:hypothetical protein
MATVTVTRAVKPEDRTAAIRLTLARPEDVLIPAAGELKRLIQENAPVESGALRSGFDEITIEKTASGASVLIGNPAILNAKQGDKAPPHTIQDFVNWVRSQNEPRQARNAQRWSQVQKEFAGRRAAKARVRVRAQTVRARRVAATEARRAHVQTVANTFRSAAKAYFEKGTLPSRSLIRQMSSPRVRATQSMRHILGQEYSKLGGNPADKEFNTIFKDFTRRRR